MRGQNWSNLRKRPLQSTLKLNLCKTTSLRIILYPGEICGRRQLLLCHAWSLQSTNKLEMKCKATIPNYQGGLVGIYLSVIYWASHHCEPGFNSGLGQHVG